VAVHRLLQGEAPVHPRAGTATHRVNMLPHVRNGSHNWSATAKAMLIKQRLVLLGGIRVQALGMEGRGRGVPRTTV
jgi:hypothetical protein